LPGSRSSPLYDALVRDSIEGELDGIALRVCSLAHLIAMKRAVGRPRDLNDLRRLGAA
jgi:hypothetical protein